MRKFFDFSRIMLFSASIMICASLSAQLKTQKKFKLSDFNGDKVKYINAVVDSYVNTVPKLDLTDQRVINEIYDVIDKEVPIQPKAKPDNRRIGELRAEAKRLIKLDKKFSMEEEEYRKFLEAKAEKIYTTYKSGEKVTLTYQKGKKRYRVTDVFRRFSGRTVSIGLRTIPYYDLIEEDKIKVNPAYAKQKQQEYVNKELRIYLAQRKDALLSKETELVRKQLKHNVDSGFVRYAEMWRYPIQVINNLLIDIIEADPRYAGKVRGLNLDSIQRIQIKLSESFDKKELEERIKMYKEDAANRVGTIDSEQGMKNIIFWRFTRDEIKHVLDASGWSLVRGKEYDLAVGHDQQVVETRLYYENGRLVKVMTVYNIDSFESFTNLKKIFLKNYGPDDRMKKKQYVRPGDPSTWTGVITDGDLHVKQNKDTGALEGRVTMTWKMVPLKERNKRAELLNKGK